LPVFALGGAGDTWVSSKRNLPLIEAALKAGGNKNVKVVEMDGLSHMLKHVQGEYDPSDIIDPRALELIAQWIKNAAR